MRFNSTLFKNKNPNANLLIELISNNHCEKLLPTLRSKLPNTKIFSKPMVECEKINLQTFN